MRPRDGDDGPLTGPPTTSNTVILHDSGSKDSTATGQPWPQMEHCDLGLVDDGSAVGS